MNCSEVKKVLPLLAGGELDIEQRSKVQAHLSECQTCRRSAGEYAKLIDLSRSVPPLEMSREDEEEFVRQTIERTESDSQYASEPKSRAHKRNRSRVRYALAGAAAVIAVALLSTFIAITSHRIRTTTGPTLEEYLARSDFRGLSIAMREDRSREALMDDSIPLDLLIRSLEQLQRRQSRYGQVARHLAQTMQEVRADLIGASVRSHPVIHLGDIPGSQSMRICIDDFDFDRALRALHRYRQTTERITPRELLKMLVVCRET